MRMIKSKDLEFISGQMVEYFKAIGKMGNSTVRVSTYCPIKQ